MSQSTASATTGAAGTASVSRPRPSMADRFTRLFAIRPVLTMAGLLFVWCALWDSVSAGVIVSGLMVAVIIELMDVGPPGIGGVRPWPLLQLIAMISWDLILSTIDVASEIITPGDGTKEGIIAVDLPSASRDHFLLFVIAVTVTPGTAVVDTDPDTGTVYLHLLYIDRAEKTAADLRRLAELADRALPVRSKDETKVGAPS